MTEELKTEFRKEGEPAFQNTDKENENSSSSSEGEENKGTDESSTSKDKEGDDANKGTKDKEEEKDGGFLNHPRWKEREEDWNKRFNDQETRHQDDLKKIREEFGEARKDNKEQTSIPSWFGGDQDAWDSYRKDRDEELKQIEEKAIERIKGEKSSQDEAIKKATEYMQSEIKAIESDKELNPDGTKVDPNKLLKFVLDNDLVDSQGRWNYKAGFKLMKNNTEVKKVDKTRKDIADATNSDSKAEEKQTAYKTSADFKGGNRPW